MRCCAKPVQQDGRIQKTARCHCPQEVERLQNPISSPSICNKLIPNCRLAVEQDTGQWACRSVTAPAACPGDGKPRCLRIRHGRRLDKMQPGRLGSSRSADSSQAKESQRIRWTETAACGSIDGRHAMPDDEKAIPIPNVGSSWRLSGGFESAKRLARPGSIWAIWPWKNYRPSWGN